VGGEPPRSWATRCGKIGNAIHLVGNHGDRTDGKIVGADDLRVANGATIRTSRRRLVKFRRRASQTLCGREFM